MKRQPISKDICDGRFETLTFYTAPTSGLSACSSNMFFNADMELERGLAITVFDLFVSLNAHRSILWDIVFVNKIRLSMEERKIFLLFCPVPGHDKNAGRLAKSIAKPPG